MDSSSGLECLVFLHTWPEPLCNPLVYLHSSVCSSWASCSETRGLWKLRARTLSSRLISGLCTRVYAIAQAGRTDSRRSIGTLLSLFLSFFFPFFLSFLLSFFLLYFQSLSFLISNYPLSLFLFPFLYFLSIVSLVSPISLFLQFTYFVSFFSSRFLLLCLALSVFFWATVFLTLSPCCCTGVIYF